MNILILIFILIITYFVLKIRSKNDLIIVTGLCTALLYYIHSGYKKETHIDNIMEASKEVKSGFDKQLVDSTLTVIKSDNAPIQRNKVYEPLKSTDSIIKNNTSTHFVKAREYNDSDLRDSFDFVDYSEDPDKQKRYYHNNPLIADTGNTVYNVVEVKGNDNYAYDIKSGLESKINWENIINPAKTDNDGDTKMMRQKMFNSSLSRKSEANKLRKNRNHDLVKDIYESELQRNEQLRWWDD